jgi:hypothetical protein
MPEVPNNRILFDFNSIVQKVNRKKKARGQSIGVVVSWLERHKLQTIILFYCKLLTGLRGNGIFTKVSEESLSNRVPEDSGKVGGVKKIECPAPKGMLLTKIQERDNI